MGVTRARPRISSVRECQGGLQGSHALQWTGTCRQERNVAMAAPQWHFADFRLDPVNARLWRGAAPLALPPKVFHVLHYLVMHPDRLVTKAELLDTVWPNTTVTDAVVRVAIGTLRKALGDT